MKKLLSITALTALTIALAAALFAAPVRSNLAAKGTNLIPDKDEGWERSTAKLYIQDGLVAMWDGIENVGWGTHDDEAPTWVDIVGGIMPTTTGTVVFAEDYVDLRNKSYLYFSNPVISQIWYSRVVTLEMVVKEVVGGNQGVFSHNRLYYFPGWIGPNGASYRFFPNDGYLSLPKAFPGSLTYISDDEYGEIYYNSILELYDFNIGGHRVRFTTFTIGKLGTDDAHYFNGSIHAIRIYNRALSDEEVSYNYSIDRQRFNLP